MVSKENKLAQFVEITREDRKIKQVCLWVKRCYENGKTVAIRVKDGHSAGYVDSLLWTFDDEVFIPHTIVDHRSGPAMEPALICTCGSAPPVMDVLIEAAGGDPSPGFEKFMHIIDFADLYDDELRSYSRRRYKAYQTAGYTLRLIKDDTR